MPDVEKARVSGSFPSRLFFSIAFLVKLMSLFHLNIISLSPPLIHQKINLNSRNSIFKRARTENFSLVDFYFLILALAFTYIKFSVLHISNLALAFIVGLASYSWSSHLCSSLPSSMLVSTSATSLLVLSQP